ncbi:MAG: hypothetical protein SFX72_13635 [Isosphaeraceae bacterium]|nr:hypothetical protein [Isosphaeraceae bacterium]
MKRMKPISRLLWISATMVSIAEAADPGPTAHLVRNDGPSAPGRVLGNRTGGFRFEPGDGSGAIPLAQPTVIVFDVPKGATSEPGSTPPFEVRVGRDQRISGRLISLDSAKVTLGVGAEGTPLSIDRAGTLAITQRTGEVIVLQEGFERFDAGRWSSTGSPEISRRDKLEGDSSLRLPAGGSTVVHRLSDPIGRGRIEIGFLDDDRTVPRERAIVELTFRGDRGEESLRAVLGWAEESLAFESPGGPALAVQRLLRKPGWRRLGVRFGPDRTEVSVDGDSLAHGNGLRGTLQQIRLGTLTPLEAASAPPADLAVAFDDLRIVRFAEPTADLEADPSQDEVRMVSGDQSFGRLEKADTERITLEVEGRGVVYPWSEVLGLYLRREARPSKPLGGLWCRAEWRAAPGVDPRDLDAVEGVLVEADAERITMQTPYAGTITLPVPRLRRLAVEGSSTRIVVDPFAHHLGDDISEAPAHLDPPQPEGGVLERKFTLAEPPAEAAFLRIDAVQVVGEAPGVGYSAKIRNGELVTNLFVNGVKVDYLNRFIEDNNETPIVVRVPVRPGVLRAGENTVRFEQVGLKNDPTYLDDLGILGLAIEFTGTPPAADARPE